MSHSFCSLLPGTGASEPGGYRLPLYRNPVRLALSASPWRGAWYLAGYLVVGSVLAAVALAVAGTAAVFAVTLAGLPLLAGAAGVLRWCANVERRRLRQVLVEPVSGRYAAATRPGIVGRAISCWHDRATWRDLAYLVGLWLPLGILDTVVLSVWAWFIGWITLPIWYWAPWMQYQGTRYHGYQLGFYFPHGPDGPGTVGVFVDTLPRALLVAAAGLAGFLLFSYVLVLTARMQARVARALLRPPADPLTAARDVLAGPGPLGPLTRPPSQIASQAPPSEPSPMVSQAPPGPPSVLT